MIDVYEPHSPTHVGGRESDSHFALLSVLANLHSFPLFNSLLSIHNYFFIFYKYTMEIKTNFS